MDQAGFIVGIDLGTSKIVGVLGRKNEQGVITILASETIPSDSCVRYGVIYNIDEAAGKIKKLINLLENKTAKKIGKVYVSVAGKSLRAIEHSETQVLVDNTTVTFGLLDKMEQQAKLNKPQFFTNYSVLAPEYYLDGKQEEDPIDKNATTVEGHYRLIVGRPNIKNNLLKAITEKCQVEIAGYIVGPVATAALVLEEADRQAGCALVDFGSGTTTVSIYKDGLLRHLTVIPFGGRTITKDVAALGFAPDSAELYKIRYGKVGKDKSKPADGETISPDVDLRELNKVIQLRQDEILLNVVNLIRQSGYAEKLDAGIIAIGGASNLNGLIEYFADKAKLSVRKGGVKRVYINNVSDIVQNPAFTQSLGILLFGNENCEKKEEEVVYTPPVNAQPNPVVTPTPQPQADPKKKDEEEDNQSKKSKKQKEDKKQTSLFKFFEKVQNFGGTMFDGEE